MAQLAHGSGAIGPATSMMQRAAQLVPDDAQTHYTYGALLLAQDRFDDAAEPLERAYQLDPNLAEVCVALGNLSRSKGLWTAAARYYEKALTLRPDLSEVETNLGAVLLAQGDQVSSVAHHEQAITLKPDFDLAQHNLLLSLHYGDAIDAGALFDRHCRWGRSIESAITPLKQIIQPDDPDRNIRLGFVSADFNNHPVSQFFLSYLVGRPATDNSVTLYSASAKRDQVTKQLIDHSDDYKNIEWVNDSDLAAMIRNDQIDILIDLSGHTAGTRIKTFAYQPAPVQVTWIGYPDTTGLTRVTYRLTDKVADPPGDADRLATETLYRLPSGFLCYHPPDDAPDAAKKTQTGRPITFASFNNLSKVTDTAIGLWSEILKRVPDSRLVLKAKSLNDDATCDRLLARFTENGVLPKRLDIRRHAVGMVVHYSMYNDVDIALDTFPYNGTTTTCDALWMGVPVVCLEGDRHSARVSASLLTSLGLDDWVASSHEQYVDIAVAAAANRAELAALQQGLRARMASSPLIDAKRFASEIDTAFRAMWRQACAE